MKPADTAEVRGARRGWWLVGLMFAVTLGSPHWASGDGSDRYEFLKALFDHGRLFRQHFSAVQPILAMPLYALGKLLRALHAVGSPSEVVAFFNAIVLLAGLAFVASRLTPKVGRAWVQAFLLVILAASMFPNHAQYFYGEVLTAVGVLAGLVLIEEGRLGWGGALLAIGVANTPAALVGAGLISLDRLRTGEKKVQALWPLLASVAIIALDNTLQHGSPLATGYEGDHGFKTVLPYSGLSGFSYPLVFGLIALLVSTGKGLLFFAPGLLLLPTSVAKELPDGVTATFRRSIWFVAGLLVVYSSWWSWYGGWFWGPRFLLYASIPASMLIATALVRRSAGVGRTVLVLGLFAFSIWVGVNGIVFEQRELDLCRANGYALEFLCWYAPEFSALFRPFVAPSRIEPMGWVFIALASGVAFLLGSPLVATLRDRIRAPKDGAEDAPAEGADLGGTGSLPR